ncbi:MAG: hypothetical protein ABSG59_13860 [Verrucomicrobiota bacterium]|jgi:hypothetical protein
MNDNDPFFAPRRLRRDAYLNTLSGNDFAKAFAILTNPAISLAEAFQTLPPWGKGPREGKRLSYVAITLLRGRFRVILAAIEAENDCRTQIPRPKPASSPASELALVEGIALAAERIIAGAFLTLNSRNRLAAARLLLRRADQRRWQIKMNILNHPAASKPAGAPPAPLTDAQKHAHISSLLAN